MLPYGRHEVTEEDIREVEAVLRGDWLTTGPMVERFEDALADFTGARHAIAISSGTAALHAAMAALGVGPGDEVIVPAMTFVASANAVVFQGATPVFADVDPATLLLDPEQVQRCLTSRSRAIVAVDYAGLPCDYVAIRQLADDRQLPVVADASHSLGASCAGRAVGTLADLTTTSFHAVKLITTGEGGAVMTDHQDQADRMRRFRNHGIAANTHRAQGSRSWMYEVVDLGYNYRITDLQCALGLSQLKRAGDWGARRRELAARYDQALASVDAVEPIGGGTPDDAVVHARHLYVVRVPADRREAAFAAMRKAEIGVQVHYIPVHLHPYYRDTFGTGEGMCPVAEAAYREIISLPLFPAMDDADIDRVVATLVEALD